MGTVRMTKVTFRMQDIEAILMAAADERRKAITEEPEIRSNFKWSADRHEAYVFFIHESDDRETWQHEMEAE